MFKLVAVASVLMTSVAFGQNIDNLKHITISEDTASVRVLNELYNYYINSDPRKALDYTLQALDISIKLNYKKGVAFSYNNIGVFYKNQGALEKAMSYYLESLELNREIGNTIGEAYSMNNIGSVYSLQSDYDNALLFYLKSYQLLDSIKDTKNIVGALNNLGNVYLAKGEDYRAIGFYKTGLRLFSEDTSANYDPYLNIGKVYFMRKEYKRAKTYYLQSLNMNNDRNNLLGKAFALHHLSGWYSANNQRDEAMRTELKALSLAEELGNNPLLMDIHLSLSELYYTAGNINEAYSSRVLYDAYKDAIYNDESHRKLAQLEVTYLLLEKEKELELLKKENELNKLRVDNTKTVIILGIMGTILLMATLFIVYVIRRNKRSGILHG
jgi:tetratricopeptide (TPR) repeat protein